MKRLIALFLLHISIMGGSLEATNSAIVAGNTVGRLGNCLLNYCYAKWLSKRTGVKFLLRPFKYADHLRLFQKEEFLNQALCDLQFDGSNRFKNKYTLISENLFKI